MLAEVEALRKQIKAASLEKVFLEQRVDDLKERAERAERKEDQLHTLLADMRPKVADAPPKGLWARLTGA